MKKILGFPNGERQLGEGFCGPNSMKQIISYKNGIEVPEISLMKLGCGSKKSGVSVRGIEKIAREFNLDYDLKINSSISDLTNSIKKENPVLLLIQAWPDRKICDWSNIWKYGHYVVATGYDEKKENIFYYDPFDGKNKSISYNKLIPRWHDYDSELVYEKFGMFFKT